MYYESTRDKKIKKNFSEVLLSGLAQDGGLFVPKKWHKFSPKKIKEFKKMSYQDLALNISKKYIGSEIKKKELKRIIENSFKNFSNKNIATLKKFSKKEWILELYHGPTLAFKDYALQVVGNVFEYILKKRKKKITIIGATSGDTGSAAIDGCKNKESMEVFIFHPLNKISEIQRRLMTTVSSKNIHNIALKGNFDDCQRIVKRLFVDKDLKSQFNFSAINSINWARILFQSIYYFFCLSKIDIKKHKLTFSVPSGNFGNIYSGYVAKKLGMPLERLIIATNENDVLSTFSNNGFIKLKKVKETITPSMDIQLPSNLERYIYELLKKKNKLVINNINKLDKIKKIKVSKKELKKIRENFFSKRITEKQTIDTIKEIYQKYNIIVDPHTAVGIAAGKKINKTKKPIVYISTAHPSKFPDTVKKAIGIEPPLPNRHRSLYKKKENYEIIDLNYNNIKKYLLKKSKFAKNV